MRLTLLLILVIALVSCAPDLDDPVAESIYFRVESSGGCAQLGPNCVRLDVYGDGTVKAYRVGEADDTPVDTGSIDTELVTALYHEAARTDLRALHEKLPPGECRGCYDGIDTAMSFFTPPSAQLNPSFSSVDVELDPSEPLFDIAWDVYRAAEASVEVPVVAR